MLKNYDKFMNFPKWILNQGENKSIRNNFQQEKLFLFNMTFYNNITLSLNIIEKYNKFKMTFCNNKYKNIKKYNKFKICHSIIISF